MQLEGPGPDPHLSRCPPYAAAVPPVAHDAASARKPVLLAENYMGVTQSERAVDCRVEVIFETDRKRLLFSVDGATAVDSGALPSELPDELVPWASLFFKGDSVTLVQHRTRATKGKPPPLPPAIVSPAPKLDMRKFEAGPWTP